MNWQHSTQMHPREGTLNLTIQVKKTHKMYKRLADYVAAAPSGHISIYAENV